MYETAQDTDWNRSNHELGLLASMEHCNARFNLTVGVKDVDGLIEILKRRRRIQEN